jgi:hypothetical protein
MTTDDIFQMLTGGLTPQERENIRHWIASLSETDFVEVYHAAAKKYYQLKEGHPDVPGKILHYCGLVLAAREYGWDTLHGKGYRVAGDDQFEDWQKIRKIRVQELRSNHNPRIKRKVMGHWGEIKELRNDGAGFRMISRYLQQYKKISVSPSYLHKIWKEMEKPYEQR